VLDWDRALRGRLARARWRDCCSRLCASYCEDHAKPHRRNPGPIPGRSLRIIPPPTTPPADERLDRQLTHPPPPPTSATPQCCSTAQVAARLIAGAGPTCSGTACALPPTRPRSSSASSASACGPSVKCPRCAAAPPCPRPQPPARLLPPAPPPLAACLLQIVESYREGRTEGLSILFILGWLLGDSLNVAGCYISDTVAAEAPMHATSLGPWQLAWGGRQRPAGPPAHPPPTPRPDPQRSCPPSCTPPFSTRSSRCCSSASTPGTAPSSRASWPRCTPPWLRALPRGTQRTRPLHALSSERRQDRPACRAGRPSRRCRRPPGASGRAC
jgi:hypothetical protein